MSCRADSSSSKWAKRMVKTKTRKSKPLYCRGPMPISGIIGRSEGFALQLQFSNEIAGSAAQDQFHRHTLLLATEVGVQRPGHNVHGPVTEWVLGLAVRMPSRRLA